MFNFGMFKFSKWWTKSVIAEIITGMWTFAKDNIKNASTACIKFANRTASSDTDKVQQSPYCSWLANVWNTTGGGSNETSEWKVENIPTSGTSPSSSLKFSYSKNGAAFNNSFFIGSGTGGTVSIFPNNDQGIISNASVWVQNSYYFITRALTTTPGVGFHSSTSDPATVGSPVRCSPSFDFTGNAWNTGSGVSQASVFRLFNLPTSGATIGGILKLQSSVAGGGYADKFFFDSSGNLGIGAASAGEKLECSGSIKSIHASDTDFDNTDVLSTGRGAFYGLAVVKETTTGKSAIFRLENQTVNIVSVDGSFSATKDNPGTINYYWETDQFKLQNNSGSNDYSVVIGYYGV